MKIVPLSEVLAFAGCPERISQPERETFVTVRLNGGGAVPRKIKDGKIPVAFTGYRVTAGQFVYSRIDARNGAFAVVPSDLHGAVVSKDFPTFDIRSHLVDTRYLIHFFRAGRLQQQIRRLSLGATNRQRIAEDQFLAFGIPLPSLNEQRRIAAILDHADGLRAKRREVREHVANLRQAIFLDMFGDPVINRRGWRRVPFAQLLSGIVSGESPNCETRPAEADEWAVLKLGAVSYGEFNHSENKAFLGDLSSIRRVEVKPGDLLFSRKNTRDLVGAVAVVYDVPPRRLLPDLIFRLDLIGDDVEAEYLHGLLTNKRKRPQIVSLASGSAGSMPNISQSRLMGLEVEVPPVDLQREYSVNVRRLNDLSGHYKTSEAMLDGTFASLQSRAFSGQL